MTRRRWLVVALYLLLIAGGWAFGHWVARWAAADLGAGGSMALHSMMWSVAAVYATACAIPFVPGAEIGFALIVSLGSLGAVVSYGGMVVAMVLAWCVGRFVPPRTTAAMFAWLGLRRAHDLTLQIAALEPQDRISAVVARSPSRAVPFLLRHRYIALAVLLNVPGNGLVGGAGGLGLAAGMSGIFAFVPFVVTIALAAAPLPLLVILTGYQP